MICDVETQGIGIDPMENNLTHDEEMDSVC